MSCTDFSCKTDGEAFPAVKIVYSSGQPLTLGPKLTTKGEKTEERKTNPAEPEEKCSDDLMKHHQRRSRPCDPNLSKDVRFSELSRIEAEFLVIFQHEHFWGNYLTLIIGKLIL